MHWQCLLSPAKLEFGVNAEAAGIIDVPLGKQMLSQLLGELKHEGLKLSLLRKPRSSADDKCLHFPAPSENSTDRYS